MKRPFIHIRVATLAAVTTLFLAGCESQDRQQEAADHHHEQDEPAKLTNVVELTPEAVARAGIRTATTVERALPDELFTTGQVDYDQDRLAHVSPRIAGRVHAVHARLGERVEAGSELAEIDSIELGQLKAEYIQARVREDLARREFEREKALYEEKIAAEKVLLEAEAGLREATAHLRASAETLRLHGLSRPEIAELDYGSPRSSIYRLAAPFAGTIVERHVALGELVTPERRLFTLADLGRVWIWIDVYQRDLARVHRDDEVQVRVDAWPGEVFTGEVSHLSAEVDSETRTVRARIDVANPAGKLRPGMFVDVELIDPHAGAGMPSRWIRESALMRPEGGDAAGRFFVFVALGERRFERRKIEIGRRAGDFAEVLAGLEAGEKVVVEGAFVLKSVLAGDEMGHGHSH